MQSTVKTDNTIFPTFSRCMGFIIHSLGFGSRWLQTKGPIWSNTWRIVPWWPTDSVVNARHSLKRILRISQGEHLDAAELVSLLAAEHRGRSRRQLRRLAQRLREGNSLADSLEQTPDMLSDEETLMVRYATQSGFLSETLNRLRDRLSRMSLIHRSRVKQSLCYFFLILLVICGFVAFLCNLINPTFLQIGAELDSEWYPRGWEALQWVRTRTPSLLLLAPALLIAFILIRRLGVFRFVRRNWAGNMIGALTKHRSAHVLNALADALQAGRSVPSGLSTLARYHFDPSLRQKLLVARNEIEQGADTWESLNIVHLLTREEARALSRLESNQLRAWLLKKFANRRSAEVDRSCTVGIALLQPALILVLGVGVLWLSYVVFGFVYQLAASQA